MTAASRRSAPLVVIGRGSSAARRRQAWPSAARLVLVTGEDVPHLSRLGADVGKRLAGWLRDVGSSSSPVAGVEDRTSGDGGASTARAADALCRCWLSEPADGRRR